MFWTISSQDKASAVYFSPSWRFESWILEQSTSQSNCHAPTGGIPASSNERRWITEEVVYQVMENRSKHVYWRLVQVTAPPPSLDLTFQRLWTAVLIQWGSLRLKRKNSPISKLQTHVTTGNASNPIAAFLKFCMQTNIGVHIFHFNPVVAILCNNGGTTCRERHYRLSPGLNPFTSLYYFPRFTWPYLSHRKHDTHRAFCGETGSISSSVLVVLAGV